MQPTIEIKVSGGMQTFRVVINSDEEADEIVVSEEKRMSLQAQVSYNLLTSHHLYQLTICFCCSNCAGSVQIQANVVLDRKSFG